MDDPHRAKVFELKVMPCPKMTALTQTASRKPPKAAVVLTFWRALSRTIPIVGQNRSSKFIAERVQESVSGSTAVPASNFAKALVVTVYERDERSLDWIIESDIGHRRPNRSPNRMI